MTDKDIKDYCKNCSVEPPAMKFKCPECKHNPDNKNNFMEDKKPIDKMIELSEELGLYKEQIIIDGVDVSKCKKMRGDYCDLHMENEFLCHCEDYPDCYFKQLARKTKECEELEERMAEVTYRATGGRLSYSNYTLDAIEQAFNDQLEILSDRKVKEETKELNQKLYLAQNEIRSKTEYIQEQRDIIKKLEQECEELKLKCLGNRNDYLCERQVTKSYRKALEEIEAIVKGMRSVFIEEISITANQLNDRIYRESTARFRQILDIINKVKGEGNE